MQHLEVSGAVGH